ncbi:hypothetical protein V1512DRAFT_273114 [Lipomyces arxii]|uniref:mitochondrial 37S ribosomal protein mS37 n=1 Tax=Lipomyces arxii TaxID=56418 RepID=UPI0034CD8520
MSVKGVPGNKLKYLKMRKPYKEIGSNECIVFMTELFNCWAGAGLNSPQCKEMEMKMKECYDTKKNPMVVRTAFNYHAKRLFPKLSRRPHD